MNLQWFSEYKGEVKTLVLKESPLYYGLGNYEDTDGNLWDVKCVFGDVGGKPLINARPVSNSPYYSTGTDSNQSGFHSFKPYRFKLVKTTKN